MRLDTAKEVTAWATAGRRGRRPGGVAARATSGGLLLAPFREIPVDRSIAERAGRLRRSSGVRTPDALIAATALEHRLTLVTRNVRDLIRDLKGLPGLRLRSPARRQRTARGHDLAGGLHPLTPCSPRARRSRGAPRGPRGRHRCSRCGTRGCRGGR
ncbi:MAG: PIN domain-containing protein [Actinomycetota bacterium]